MTITLDSKIPAGPLADKWENFKADEKLVNPARKCLGRPTTWTSTSTGSPTAKTRRTSKAKPFCDRFRVRPMICVAVLESPGKNRTIQLTRNE